MEVEAAASIAVDTAFRLHMGLGPGLLESVYETVLAGMLARRGLKVERQMRVPLDFDGIRFDEAARIDLLVEGHLVIEVKSVESLAPVHTKQLLTYLRLLELPLGLLINFGAPTFKQGIRRVLNNRAPNGLSR